MTTANTGITRGTRTTPTNMDTIYMMQLIQDTNTMNAKDITYTGNLCTTVMRDTTTRTT